MLRLHRHVVVDDRHLDVVDHLLVLHLHLIYMEMLVHQLMALQCVEETLHLLVDETLVDVLQILDELNLDEVLTYQDVAVHRLVVVVDVVLFHQLKMDYFLDVVGEELLHQVVVPAYCRIHRAMLF